MMTVDIAINGKSIGKLTVVNDGKHAARPRFGSYDVTAEVDGYTYHKRVWQHDRLMGMFDLVEKAAAEVVGPDCNRRGRQEGTP